MKKQPLTVRHECTNCLKKKGYDDSDDIITDRLPVRPLIAVRRITNSGLPANKSNTKTQG